MAGGLVTHMEQLVIILLIALISIINWIIQKSKETREKRKLEKRADATGEPVAKQEPGPDATGTETAMRRLREALGLPEEAPPPVIPKRAEPKRVEPERIEPKRMEPKKVERPVSCRSFARPAGSATASSARKKASCRARSASAALAGASQVRISPQDRQAFATRGAETASSDSRTSPVARRFARCGRPFRDSGSTEELARAFASLMNIEFVELREALQERLDVIADHELRARDPRAHLERLKAAASRLDAAIARFPPDAIPSCATFSNGRVTSRHWPGLKPIK